MNIQSQKLPLTAIVLGYAGIIPFVVLAVCIAAGIDLAELGFTDPVAALTGYGAVIISFIGAVHWGVALHSAAQKQNILFIYSVLPSLAAWVWLLSSGKTALIGMGLTIVAMFFIDRWLLSNIVPQAYLKMRMYLSIIVSACLFLAALR